MQATLELPIVLDRLTPEEITWLAAKSSAERKSTADVTHDLIAQAAKNAGFIPSPSPVLNAGTGALKP